VVLTSFLVVSLSTWPACTGVGHQAIERHGR